MVHKPEDSDPLVDINLVGHVHDRWRIRTYSEHYDIIEHISSNLTLPSDRPDFKRFLEVNKKCRNSNSILLNVGLDVQNYMPISLDEVIYQVNKFKSELKDKSLNNA
jgi:calcineurin-like phosphoesterase family protein